MDNIAKMRNLQIFFIIVMLPLFELAELDKHFTVLSKTQFNVLSNGRKKREADEEDVVNRFEMERVSPLYDILKHLPPFEDGWIHNGPVTSPSFPSVSSTRLKNGSSSYGEFKIEVSKDEEHVVSESGKQFKENSALNWYYSAESFSSVNNFTHNNRDSSKSLITTTVPTTVNVLEKISLTKPAALKKQDEEHVVSHVPSLKGGRGTFLDFNLLESSTTPKIDSIVPSKVEVPKPNITTRYILLQSGRIVAINVTSVSPAIKPISSSSGSGNKAPFQPTFYFGSRIKNKNAAKSPNNVTSNQTIKKVTTVKPAKLELTTQINAKRTTELIKNVHLKVNTFPVKSTNKYQETTNQPSTKKAIVNTVRITTINPNVEYFRPYRKTSTPSVPNVSITPHVEYSKLKQNSIENKSQQQKQLQIDIKSQVKALSNSTKPLPHPSKEDISLDPAQKWWRDMKAARKERMSLTTTLRPKTTTQVVSSHILKTLYNVLQPTPVDGSLEIHTFDSMKKPSEEPLTHSTFELTANGRSAKLRMTEKYALHFSTTASPENVLRASFTTRSPRVWTTLASATESSRSLNENPVTRTVADPLEPPVPRSNAKHEFVRIVTLPPPVSSVTTLKAHSTTTSPHKKDKASSRRPRYRGLSHVNLQSPRQQSTPSTKKPSLSDLSTKSQFQLTTASYRGPVNYQWWVSQPLISTTQSTTPTPIATPPTQRSKPGFYLRNSFSFQTIFPGSLTDRRTLTTEATNYVSGEDGGLQPPFEDLLIISFEPTRKYTGKETEDVTEKSTPVQEKVRSFRTPAKKSSISIKTPAVAPKKSETVAVSTEKPRKRLTDKPTQAIHHDNGGEQRTNAGNRQSRLYRNNNSRFQSVAEKTSAGPSSSTTKQPFKVYYFEPKRRKQKVNSDADEKNETSRASPLTTRGRSQSESERNHSTLNRGVVNVENIERRTHTASNNHPNRSRSAKQLQLSGRNQRPTSTASTTTSTTIKPVVSQRLKSSPFIWHRPNVGTARSVV